MKLSNFLFAGENPFAVAVIKGVSPLYHIKQCPTIALSL